ncbi:hypothetical protein BW39_04582 [Delftia sp. RIT313]|nr:hypothetical protein BW39_04582 [Delftia sp. RIT313]
MACDAFQRRQPPIAQGLRNRRQALVLEDLGGRHLQAALARQRGHAQAEDGVPAQREEIVLAPHALDAQHLRPDPGQGLLHGALRRLVAGIGLCVRLGQRLAVELAVGIERHRVQLHDQGRHHVLGQGARQRRAQCLDIDGLPGPRTDVADQPHAAGPLARHRHSLLHLRLGQQLRLDFAQFDAQAAYLHLLVDAAQVFQFPVDPPANQIARPVQALAVAERTGHEALCAESRPVQIAARQVRTRQVQLAGHAHGRRAQICVQHMGAGLADGTAYGHLAAPVVAAAPVRHVDGRFGGPVEVEQAHLRQAREHPGLRFGGQGLSTAENALQAGAARQIRMLQKGLQHGRHKVQRGYPVSLDQLGKPLGVAVLPGTGQHQPGAMHQGPEELPHRDIEAEGCLLQHHVRWLQPIGLLHPQQPVAQRAMAVGRALGPPGGAGGVDHIDQVLRAERWIGVGTSSLFGRRLIQLHHLHGFRPLRHARAQVAVGEQQGDAAVVHHVAQALGGVVGVQRHIGSTGLENGQQCHHHADGALHGNTHARLGPYTPGHECVGQPVGPVVEFAVAQDLIRADQGDGLGRLGGPGLEHAVDRRSLVEAPCVGAPPLQLQQLLRRQQVQAAGAGAPSFGQGLHHGLQRLLQVQAQPPRMVGVGGLRGQREASTLVVHRHGHGIGRALAGRKHADAFPAGRRPIPALAVPVVQQAAEQRRGAGQAAAFESQRQGGMLMRQQSGKAVAGLAQQSVKVCATEPQAHRQRVDEHADSAAHVLRGLHAAEQYGAEHHVLRAADPGQHQGPRQMEQRGRIDLPASGAAVQRARQPGIQCQPVLGHRLLQRQQAEGRRGLVHIAQQFREEGLMALERGLVARQLHEPAKGNGRGQQIGPALMDQPHLAHQQLQRRMVHYQVVAGQLQQPALMRGIEGGNGPDHGSLPHIEAELSRVHKRGKPLFNGDGSIAFGQPFQAQRSLPADHLHRLRQPLPEHRRAQDVVARDALVQPLHESQQPGLRIKAQQAVGHIAVATRLHQVMKQNAFLQGRQRIGILDIGRAARDGGLHGAQMIGLQSHQRQHVGLQPLAPLGHP